MLMQTDRPRRVCVSNFIDARGSLGVIEQPTLPFDVKRLYFLHDLEAGVIRGRHAHKALQQVMICLAGAVDVTVWDGQKHDVIRLQSRDEGLYFPAGFWREIMPIADQSILAVLASDPYDETDYIYTEEDYLAYLVASRSEH